MADDKNLKDQAKSQVENASKNKKKTEAEIALEQAQQSLTNLKESDKAKNSAKIKQMTAYQEQALQGATKSKGNKKVLIIVVVLLLLALLIGGGVAVFFIFKPEPEKPASVVCDVRVVAYAVQLDPEDYIIVGSNEFSFTEETEKTSHFTNDIVQAITDLHDIALMYVINNTSGKNYVYSLNFEDLDIKNCIVSVKTSLGNEVYNIDSTRRVVQLTYDKDITLEIRITVDDNTIADAENTGCSGGINLTLSVS